MDGNPSNIGIGISIQVSLSGYSFRIASPAGDFKSGWLGADKLFTTPELQRRYSSVEISLLTPKVALVPSQFFDPASARQALGDVVALRDEDQVSSVEVPDFGAVLVYSNSIDESLSKVISQSVLTTSGEKAEVLPEMYFILRELRNISEYNKILASYMDGHLHLAVAQGRTLLLCNVFDAADFTTAEYFIFMALKKFQLNPEVSVIRFRTPLSKNEEMSLYRYFKSVEVI